MPRARSKRLSNDPELRDFAAASRSPARRPTPPRSASSTPPRGGHLRHADGRVRGAVDPLVRAAHLACLEHGRHTHEDGLPTVETWLAFARVFGVPGAELAAFFGFIGQRHGGRTIWADALRGDMPSYTARHQATRAQAVALGFTQMVAEVPPVSSA